ncbi:hypothetical protein GF367_02170 [Candidatus Woesearchaeota archaeon]|nr:hypothetical protein [Candidatus Woesearchaeota archaeon]
MAEQDAGVVKKPWFEEEVDGGGLPDKVLDVFGEEKVDDVLRHDHDIRMYSLMRDVDMYLRVGDFKGER